MRDLARLPKAHLVRLDPGYRVFFEQNQLGYGALLSVLTILLAPRTTFVFGRHRQSAQ